MLENKIFWRIYLTTTALALIGAVIVYINLASELDKQNLNQTEQAYTTELPMAALLAEALLSGSMSELPPRPLFNNQKRLTIINPEGVVVHDSFGASTDEDFLLRPEVIQAKTQGSGYVKRLAPDQKSKEIFLAKRIDLNDAFLGYVILSGQLDFEGPWSDWLLERFIFSISIAFGLLATVTYIFAHYFFQPIERATALAQRLSLVHQLNHSGKQDLPILENSLHMMAGQLEQKVTSLDENIDLLSSLLNAMKEGVVAVNSENQIIHINTAALELFSLDANIKGQDLMEIDPFHELNTLTKNIGHSESAPPVILEVNRRILEVQTTRQGEANSKTKGFLFTIQDITERTLADNIRVEFVANASHQLKTPIASIKGIVETIIDSDQMEAETRQKFLVRVSDQADNLNNIVMKLMQLARLEQFHNFYEGFVTVELNRLLREVIDSQADIAEFHEISINLVSENDAIQVKGEPEFLHQAFANLIDNAIKYSPPSTCITVNLKVEADQSIISIKDQGLGIPTADQGRIFERFYRAGSISPNKASGTGLGLSIAKAAIESNRGSIKLKRSTPKGSEFTIALPLHVRKGAQ